MRKSILGEKDSFSSCFQQSIIAGVSIVQELEGASHIIARQEQEKPLCTREHTVHLLPCLCSAEFLHSYIVKLLLLRE